MTISIEIWNDDEPEAMEGIQLDIENNSDEEMRTKILNAIRKAIQELNLGNTTETAI